MEDWKEYKLGDIGTVVGGATPSTKETSNYDGNIPWITPKDLANHRGRYISHGERMITQAGFNSCSCRMLPKNSILFSSRAPIGYVAIANNELCTNQGFKSIIPNKNVVDSLFLYYLLVYYRPVIENLGSGTTFKEVSGSVMKNLVVNIPKVEEQKKIAAILSSLDDKIELNRRINDNLEQQAQALFKAWFVDFEPFKDGDFVDSEFGRIPEGWEILCAEDVYNINIGKTPPRNEYIWFSKTEKSNIKWISISDLADCGTYVGNSSEYLTPQAISKFNIAIVPSDTVLLSFKLTVGRVAIAKNRLTTNEAIARFYLPNPAYREFTYLTLKNYDYSKLGNTSSIATAVNSKIIKNMKILFPNTEDIEKFHNTIKPIFDLIKSNSDEMERLGKLRDTLLSKLMSGKLKIE